jgi:hypothetical protein
MHSVRAIVTVFVAAAAFILPTIGTAYAGGTAPTATGTSWSSTSAFPDGTPWGE